MTSDDQEQNLSVLHNIESCLKIIYDEHPAFTDAKASLAMSKARAAIKQRFGYGKGLNSNPDDKTEERVITAIVAVGMARIGKIGNLTLAGFDKCLTQVMRSVEHHRDHGPRGYYDFIKSFV